MKSRNISDDFTNALSKEMLSRKIFDKAKPKLIEEEIFLAESKNIENDSTPPQNIEIPKFQPVKRKKRKSKKISQTESTSANEKISADEKIIPTPKLKIPKKVEDKSDFEKRVFAEAENDFYDEKPLKPAEEKIFHSKNLKSDVITDEEKEIKPEEKFDPNLYRKLTRAEISGIALSTIMLAYSFVNLDKPLFFMAMSLLAHLLRPLIGSIFGKYNRDVQNALRSFSIVLFLGAILFIFL